MKTVIIVAPHFLPSFLASVHRARLWAYHLQEFGWKPIILTTNPSYYECQLDWELLDLLPDDLEVVILGPRVERTLGIPYGLDYIDPWVPETPTGDRFLSKAWIANGMSHFLEPVAVRRARLITGINDAYFASVLSRNPKLRARVVTAGMPYGCSERDFEALQKKPRETFLFDPDDGKIHVIYAGAMLPKAYNVLERLFSALVLLRQLNVCFPRWSYCARETMASRTNCEFISLEQGYSKVTKSTGILFSRTLNGWVLTQWSARCRAGSSISMFSITWRRAPRY